MNDKPGNEQFDDSHVEDFDFGEGDTEQRTPIQTKSKGLNKKVLGFFLLALIATVGVIGYKYYGNSVIPKFSRSSTTTAAVAAPAVKPATVNTANPVKPLAKPTEPSTPPASEQNFGEIAQAFSSADHPAGAVPTAPIAKPNTPTKTTAEGSIQDLQKELFSPEKPSGSGTSTKAPTVAAAETNAGPETAELSQGLTKLNQQIDFILNQIKYLDSYSREVSENLNKLNQSISAMDNRLMTLTNTTSTLSKDVGNVRNEMGQVRQVLKEDGLDMNPVSNAGSGRKGIELKEGKISIEEPEYSLHAVIPGRAWLKSAKGQILTVAEGDTVGNYGKILVIDAANGVVLTSSGVTFR